MTKLYRVLILFLVFFGLGISCASAENVVSFDPQTSEVYPGSSQDIKIIIDEVPEGLSGFNLTVSILDPEIAEITAVSFPDWGQLPRSSTLPSGSVWIKVSDLGSQVGPGDTNVLLGTITVTGKKVGSTDLNIPTTKISADGGSLITPAVIKGKINVLDKELPVINSVTLSDTTPETGDSITVTVDVTDNVGVSSVTASGVALTNKGGNIWQGTIVALEGTHSVSVSAVDKAGNVASDNSASYTALTSDNLPPSSISNIQSTRGTTWIKWTWQNPKDTDFDHTEIYLNGAYQTSTSAEYFNATGLLPETSYTIGTRTVDTNGNMNKAWVNQTAITEKESVPEIKLPLADFTADPTEGYAPLSVQFTDLSENAASWSWDFGDGSKSTEKNPTHTYSTAGIYTVNLTVSNENGMDSKITSINVSEKTVSVLPIANFSANVTEGYAPLTVSFTDLSENAISWSWDFGDGATSIEKNPVHTYSTAGIYTVNLTVSNENGTDSKIATINVTEKAVSVIPVANFTSNLTEGFVPLTIQFTDLSENAISFNWDFGDGSSSIEQNPVHTYFTTGIYTVNLTVSNENGMDSKLATINVTEKAVSVLPVANFTANVTEGFVPLAVQFTDLSENAASWSWDFGDGDNSTEENPIHTYSTAGKYNVTLTVKNEMDNNTLTKYDYIYVKEGSDDDNEIDEDDNEIDEDDNEIDEDDNEVDENDEETCEDDEEVSEDDKETCEETKPACKETKPVCKETKPVCKETKPVCKETKPVCVETKPVCAEAKPVCKETKPVCEDTKNIDEEEQTADVDVNEEECDEDIEDEVDENDEETCEDDEEVSQEDEEVSQEDEEICEETKPVCEDTENVDEEEQTEDADVEEECDEDIENKVDKNDEETCEEAKPVCEDAEKVNDETGNVGENEQTEDEGSSDENVDENEQTEDEGSSEDINEPTETVNSETEKV